MKKIYLFILLIFTAYYCQAKNYYVDSITGNDSWNGSFPEHTTDSNGPFKTISKINERRLSPGDQVFFKRNCSWNEILNISSSGTTKKTINYTAYGSGNKPEINGNNKLKAGISAAASNIQIEDISICNINGQGIEFSASEGNFNIILSNLNIINTSYGNAVLFINGGGNISISNVYINGAKNSGIALMGSVKNHLKNTVIKNCIIQNIKTNDGITLHKDGYGNNLGSNHKIMYNYLSDCNENGLDITAGKDIELSKNIVINNKQPGILLDHGAENVSAYLNLIINNKLAGISIGEAANINISLNFCTNNLYSVSFAGDNTNVKVTGNILGPAKNNILDFNKTSNEIFISGNIIWAGNKRNIIRFLNPECKPYKNNFLFNNNYFYSSSSDKRHVYVASAAKLMTIQEFYTVYQK